MRRKSSKEMIEDRQRLLELAKAKLAQLDRKQLRKFLSAFKIPTQSGAGSRVAGLSAGAKHG